MGYKFKIYSRRFFAWIPMREFSSATKNPKAYWRNDRSVFCRTPSVCAFTEWTFAILSQHLHKLSAYSLGLPQLRSEPVLRASLLLTTCAPSLQSSSQLPVLFRKEKSQPEAVGTAVLFGVGGIVLLFGAWTGEAVGIVPAPCPRPMWGGQPFWGGYSHKHSISKVLYGPKIFPLKRREMWFVSS